MSKHYHLRMKQILNKDVSQPLDKFARLEKNQTQSNPIPEMPGFYGCLSGPRCSRYVQLSPKIEAGETRIQFHNTWFPDGNPL